MRIRILGCGPSSGVPRIGNDWGDCDPTNPKNRRTRLSILLESGGQRLLIDCGPDLRAQLLAAGIGEVDGAIVTHDHADHCHGIDDLRQVAANRGAPVPLYARAQVLKRLARHFSYVFEGVEFYTPTVTSIAITDKIEWGACQLRFADQPHGKISSLGIRADEGDRSLAYAVDFHDLTPEMEAMYSGVGTWIAACTPQQRHPTHANLDAVLGWAHELNVGQLLLTHLDKSLDYATLASRLPDWAEPAYDGLELVL